MTEAVSIFGSSEIAASRLLITWAGDFADLGDRVAMALVDKAGATMVEVVAAIKRVTDHMGDISAASQEQSAGVAQVGEAVTSLDRTTQQNAALVEQRAAAARLEGLQVGQ